MNQDASDEENRTNLIINFLPRGLQDDEFRKIFEVCGKLKTIQIVSNLKKNYSRGFGFVEYENPEDAARAILKLNNLSVQFKRIKVSYAGPPNGEDCKESNLYVQNIPVDYTLDQLAEVFSPFGEIVHKNILVDKMTGVPRGVGFVRYAKKAEADAAIVNLNKIVPPGGFNTLIVKVADDHGTTKLPFRAGYNTDDNRGNSHNQGDRGFSGGRVNFNSGGGGGNSNYNRGAYNNRGGSNFNRGNVNHGNFNGENYNDLRPGNFGRGGYNGQNGGSYYGNEESMYPSNQMYEPNYSRNNFGENFGASHNSMTDYRGQHGGKIISDRGNSRYNPIGGGPMSEFGAGSPSGFGNYNNDDGRFW